MKELRNFTPTPKVKEEKKKEETMERVSEKGLEDMIKDREGRTEKELMDELLQSVRKSKAEGRYSEKDMDNFKKTVMPLLNDEQRKKLDEILLLLK